MKLKYLSILIILITISLEISAQKNLTNFSGLSKSDVGLKPISENVLKINVKQPTVYSGIASSINLDFEFDNNEYDDVYFKGDMPTVNQ